MSEFVEECRREWRRLRVPDAVANEMAADLEADLKEAEAEGASAEEVLGSGAFDPRAFAAAWAAERGVGGPPPAAAAPAPVFRGVERPPRRFGLPTAFLAFGSIALIGLAIASRRSGSSQGIASPFIRRFALPAPGFPVGPFAIHVAAVSVVPDAIALLLFLLGIGGLIVAMVYWSPWSSSGRWAHRRPGGNTGPGGAGFD